jgi:hypothetical protein
MAAKHPAKAFGYQGICYLGGANYDLGTSETIPSLSFESRGPVRQHRLHAGGPDADCALVVQDFLTNDQYGVQLPHCLG